MESGDRFGHLTVCDKTDAEAELLGPAWVAARCDCGKAVAVLAVVLANGRATSCGCSTRCVRCIVRGPHICQHTPSLQRSPVL